MKRNLNLPFTFCYQEVNEENEVEKTNGKNSKEFEIEFSQDSSTVSIVTERLNENNCLECYNRILMCQLYENKIKELESKITRITQDNSKLNKQVNELRKNNSQLCFHYEIQIKELNDKISNLESQVDTSDQILESDKSFDNIGYLNKLNTTISLLKSKLKNENDSIEKKNNRNSSNNTNNTYNTNNTNNTNNAYNSNNTNIKNNKNNKNTKGLNKSNIEATNVLREMTNRPNLRKEQPHKENNNKPEAVKQISSRNKNLIRYGTSGNKENKENNPKIQPSKKTKKLLK